MLTGSGSTAMTITWALSLLLNHPEAIRAAQQELDDQIGKHRWVEESDLKHLIYLQAIVKETLRLYPPAPLTGIREAMEDCELAGYHVPKGTRLLVNIWKIQRDPQMWKNPCEFQPERFLTTNVNVELKSPNFEYLPFGYGRRSCPGMTFGMHVVHLTLARVLQGFDVAAMGDGPVNMEEGLGVAMPKLRPLDVALNPRLPLSLYDAI